MSALTKYMGSRAVIAKDRGRGNEDTRREGYRASLRNGNKFWKRIVVIVAQVWMPTDLPVLKTVKIISYMLHRFYHQKKKFNLWGKNSII